MIPQDKIDVAIKSLRNKKIFLTGGTGFFGRSLLDFIKEHAQSVPFRMIILSRNPEQFLDKWPHYKSLNQISFQKGDLQNINAITEKFDLVLHFAAIADAKINQENSELTKNVIINGTKNVLQFAKMTEVKNVLFASSGAVYGKKTAYSEGKKIAEEIGSNFAKENNFQFKIARCFAFVGPHLDLNGSFAIGNFIGDALSGNIIKISGDGTPYRSYLYSEDLIVWLLNILENGKNLEAYDVGSDEEISIQKLAEKVIQLVNPNAKLFVMQKADPIKEPDRYVPDISKARSELGLDVWTSLELGILKTSRA